jgi:exopolysaccharide biosynthesis polyprenyl glycosylphosphotransferase
MHIIKKIALILADFCLALLALTLMIIVRYGENFNAHFSAHFVPFSILFILWIFVFYLADLYRFSTFRTELSIAKSLFQALLVSGVVSIVVLYLFPELFRLTPKTNLLIVAILFFVLDYLLRLTVFRFVAAGRTPIVIIGDSPLIQETITYLEKNPQLGYRVERWVKEIPRENYTILQNIIKETGIGTIILSPRLINDQHATTSLFALLPLRVSIINFLDFYETIFDKVALKEIDTEWFVQHISTRRKIYDIAKRIGDIILSFVLSITLLPLFFIIGILIGCSSKGWVIFPQKRIGKNGEKFTLYKFRTMKMDSQGALWTEKNDARITAIGSALRFTHLDELPQLWNILKGDISFTGPRPERTELAEQYKKFAYYDVRHIIKPGLTGWAQINFRPSASFEEAYEKLTYDIYYVKNRSLFLDLLIILRTIRYIFISH